MPEVCSRFKSVTIDWIILTKPDAHKCVEAVGLFLQRLLFFNTCLQWDTNPVLWGGSPGMEPLLEWWESARLGPGSQ